MAGRQRKKGMSSPFGICLSHENGEGCDPREGLPKSWAHPSGMMMHGGGVAGGDGVKVGGEAMQKGWTEGKVAKVCVLGAPKVGKTGKEKPFFFNNKFFISRYFNVS